MMKPYFLILVTLAHYVAAGDEPLMQSDPETVKDCAGWYDNTGDLSCESVRKLSGIKPEEFHEWNPSVGLDCKPWADGQSYCIITQRKVDAAWTEMGCYAEDPAMPILEQNIDPNGDTSLTIPKCENTCYRRAYRFAGVQQGNQCWCSSYIGGEWAKNQTDCDTPCTGDKNALCGGTGFLNVFKALENSAVTSTTSTGNVKSSASVQSSASPMATVKTGAAAKNAIWVRDLIRL